MPRMLVKLVDNTAGAAGCNRSRAREIDRNTDRSDELVLCLNTAAALLAWSKLQRSGTSNAGMRDMHGIELTHLLLKKSQL